MPYLRSNPLQATHYKITNPCPPFMISSELIRKPPSPVTARTFQSGIEDYAAFGMGKPNSFATPSP
jgi:hypothetical protein